MTKKCQRHLWTQKHRQAHDYASERTDKGAHEEMQHCLRLFSITVAAVVVTLDEYACPIQTTDDNRACWHVVVLVDSLLVAAAVNGWWWARPCVAKSLHIFFQVSVCMGKIMIFSLVSVNVCVRESGRRNGAFVRVCVLVFRFFYFLVSFGEEIVWKCWCNTFFLLEKEFVLLCFASSSS